MVRSSSGRLELTRNGSRLHQNSRPVVLVGDGILFGVRVICVAHLMPVDATPGQKLACLSASDRVMLAAHDLGDLAPAQRLDDTGHKDHGIILAAVIAVARLRVVVQPPTPDLFIVVDEEAVVRTSADVNRILARVKLAAAGGSQTGLLPFMTRRRLAAELELAATAPGVNLARDV